MKRILASCRVEGTQLHASGQRLSPRRAKAVALWRRRIGGKHTIGTVWGRGYMLRNPEDESEAAA